MGDAGFGLGRQRREGRLKIKNRIAEFVKNAARRNTSSGDTEPPISLVGWRGSLATNGERT